MRRVDPLVLQLRDRRIRLGMSLRAVERAMGYAGGGLLGKYEDGRASPGLDLLRRWAEALAVTLAPVPLDEDSFADTDPDTLPPELLTPTAQRERARILAADPRVSAADAARLSGVSERTIHRHREHHRNPGTENEP